jgi:hypothetical protein
MHPPLSPVRRLTLAIPLGLLLSSAWGEERPRPADLLPKGPLAVLEAQGLGKAIDRVMTSKTLETILASPQWQEAIKQPDIVRAQAGRNLIEAQLGGNLIELAKKVLGGELAIGVYPGGKSNEPKLAAALRSTDGATLNQLVQKAEDTLKLFAPKAISVEQAAGRKILDLQKKLYVGLAGDWLAAATDRSTLDGILRQLESKGSAEPVLAGDADWKKFAATRAPTDLVRVWARTQPLLKLLPNDGRPPKKPDNAVGALLVVGPTETLLRSDFITASLGWKEDRLGLEVNYLLDPKKLPANLLGFFEPGQLGTTPPVPTDTILHLAMYRDFQALYKAREEFLDASVLPEFDKFEAGLTTFLPGRNFTQDVLPMFGRSWTTVIGPQTFDGAGAPPRVQLPAFATILEPGDPEQANDMADLVFQSIVSIINLTRGERGGTGEPMVVSSTRVGDVNIAFGRPMAGRKKLGPTEPRDFESNFTPASLRLGDRFIFTSSKTHAERLAAKKEGDIPPAYSARPAGTRRDMELSLAVAPLLDSLRKNREVIEARMVQEGRRPERAKQELDVAEKVLAGFRTLRMQSDLTPSGWRMEMEVSW